TFDPGAPTSSPDPPAGASPGADVTASESADASMVPTSPGPRGPMTPDPTPTPPPGTYLRIGAPPTVSISLRRDAMNAGSMQISPDTDGSWTLSVRGFGIDEAGHMTNESGLPLGAAMTAAVVPGDAVSLEGDGGRLTTGIGTGIVTVTVYQAI